MKIKNISKWILAQTSVLTMVMLPVAQGQAANNQKQEINKAMVQNAIYEMGLNKSMTYGEFFKKNKDKYPERLQKELAPYFEQHANQPMPQFDIGTVKGSDGVTYPTLRISQNGQLHNIQFFGEENKYVKFNNTNLTETDLINFDDMLVKLSAGDEKLRKQLDTSTSKVTPKTFSGFPSINTESWSKLTPEQRAGYVISMRLLYNDAHGVLLALKNKNTKNKKFSFFNSLIEKEAYAKVNKSNAFNPITDQDNAASGSTSSASAPNNGLDSCLVAGYVTTYKGQVCTYQQMKEEYKNDRSISGRAFVDCGNKIACNPLVFGTPNGKPICIDRAKNSEVQRATHYRGPCETNNQTGDNHTNSEINFIKKDLKDTGRYAKDNLTKTSDQIKQQALDEQSKLGFKATKDFIDGVLKYDKDPEYKELFTSKTPNEKLIKKLLEIKNDFDNEIKQATEACRSASRSNNGKIEQNFWGACDQLQRRFLFVQEYLNDNPGCTDKKTVSETTLMCPCADGSEVVPGGSCKITPPGNQSGDPTVIPPGTVDNSKCDPACTDKQECKLQAELDGIQSWQCVDKKSGKPVDPIKKKKKSGFLNFLNKALPWVVGAGVLVGMYYLWKPKKVKLNGAGDICPDGTNAPCGVQCAAPKVYVAGSGCTCSACPPGQTITNAATCECGTQSNTTTYVCADGVTIVATASDCPSSLYTCWDGSQVTNVINCPEKPATKMDSGTTK